jgi:hypothetical protein
MLCWKLLFNIPLTGGWFDLNYLHNKILIYYSTTAMYCVWLDQLECTWCYRI